MTKHQAPEKSQALSPKCSGSHVCADCGDKWECLQGKACGVNKAALSNKTGPFCGLCMHSAMAMRYAAARGIKLSIRGKPLKAKLPPFGTKAAVLVWELTMALMLWCCMGSAAEVRFTWRANGEPDLAGYKIYCGSESRQYTNAIVLGLVTNCWMEVAPHKQYFALSAFTSTGLESDLTEELVWDPPAPGLRVVSERSLDGVLWEAAATNAVEAKWRVEFWRVQVIRETR